MHVSCRLGAMLGVFDSGVGGLNVLKAIREALPDASIMYLGDSARTPYGNQSRSVVTAYTKECCMELFRRGCSLIVLACNTASADTLPELQQKWLPEIRAKFRHPINIIGVIRPLAEEAAQKTRSGRIAVVGTRSTIASKAYVREIAALKQDAVVLEQACPLLVPLIEEGWIAAPETRRILRKYVRPLKTKNPDVLILGCTHYEALRTLFCRMMGRRCVVLHTPSIVAGKLAAYLERHPEYAIHGDTGLCFLTTGDPERFREVGSLFFGAAITNIELISLAQKTGTC